MRKQRGSLHHEPSCDDRPAGEGEPNADADALENCELEMGPSDQGSGSESDSSVADLDYGQPASSSPQSEQREPDQAVTHMNPRTSLPELEPYLTAALSSTCSCSFVASAHERRTSTSS